MLRLSSSELESEINSAERIIFKLQLRGRNLIESYRNGTKILFYREINCCVIRTNLYNKQKRMKLNFERAVHAYTASGVARE